MILTSTENHSIIGGNDYELRLNPFLGNVLQGTGGADRTLHGLAEGRALLFQVVRDAQVRLLDVDHAR